MCNIFYVLCFSEIWCYRGDSNKTHLSSKVLQTEQKSKPLHVVMTSKYTIERYFTIWFWLIFSPLLIFQPHAIISLATAEIFLIFFMEFSYSFHLDSSRFNFFFQFLNKKRSIISIQFTSTIQIENPHHSVKRKTKLQLTSLCFALIIEFSISVSRDRIEFSWSISSCRLASLARCNSIQRSRCFSDSFAVSWSTVVHVGQRGGGRMGKNEKNF